LELSGTENGFEVEEPNDPPPKADLVPEVVVDAALLPKTEAGVGADLVESGSANGFGEAEEVDPPKVNGEEVEAAEDEDGKVKPPDDGVAVVFSFSFSGISGTNPGGFDPPLIATTGGNPVNAVGGLGISKEGFDSENPAKLDGGLGMTFGGGGSEAAGLVVVQAKPGARASDVPSVLDLGFALCSSKSF
jgi:hypothetical protein